ncbi:MAG: glycogen-binding domain-containing protein [Gemmatimonadales bacterium]
MRLLSAPCVGMLLSVIAVSPRLAAQRWQVDLGATGVAYDTFSSVASAVVAPSVEWQRPRAYGLASGSFAAFAGAQWTAQGRGDLSLFMPLGFELAGSAGGSVHSTGYRTATTRGELRIHLSGRGGGVWAGGHAGTGWTSDTSDIAFAYGPSVGAWGRVGRVSALAVFVPFHFEGAWLPEANARVAGTHGRLDVLAYAGWRGATQGVNAAFWGGASVAVWVTPRIALVAGAGTYPADLLQALPRGRYVSASIRLARRSPSVWPAPTTGRALYATERGVTELRFAVPGASRVAVVGDWTGWQPVLLERGADGRWVMRVTLGPGVYRFNVIVDGTRWTVPADVAAVDDGFGGQTALLVVP